ncbi:unnamed protein product [Cercospora beticola]|nr:unnamed protein product [Cercospora beticola]
MKPISYSLITLSFFAAAYAQEKWICYKRNGEAAPNGYCFVPDQSPFQQPRGLACTSDHVCTNDRNDCTPNAWQDPANGAWYAHCT